MEKKLYKTLKKVFDLIDGPWDEKNKITNEIINDINILRYKNKRIVLSENEITNDITIDPIEILSMPDNSITDPETIRQIALYSIKYNTNTLNNKIKKEFEYCGLYPHLIKTYNINPDDKI